MIPDQVSLCSENTDGHGPGIQPVRSLLLIAQAKSTSQRVGSSIQRRATFRSRQYLGGALTDGRGMRGTAQTPGQLFGLSIHGSCPGRSHW